MYATTPNLRLFVHSAIYPIIGFCRTRPIQSSWYIVKHRAAEPRHHVRVLESMCTRDDEDTDRYAITVRGNMGDGKDYVPG